MKRTGVRRTLIALAALLGILSGCGSKAPEKVEKQLFAMDTVMTLTVYGENAGAALDAAAAEINETARLLDPEHYGVLSLMVIFTTLANVFRIMVGMPRRRDGLRHPPLVPYGLAIAIGTLFAVFFQSF